MSADPYPDIRNRFVTARTGNPPTSQQRVDLAVILEATVDLALAIEKHTAPGRDQSLALTHLEDTLMRANRAVFTAAPES
jgi:hypothetical protein